MPENANLRELKWVLENVGIGVWSWDIVNDRVTWSPGLARIFGHPDRKPPTNHKEYHSWLDPDDVASMMNDVKVAIAAGKAEFLVQHRVVRADGSVAYLSGVAHIELGANGRPARMGGTIQDVTSMKEQLMSLEAREETFRLFSELASDYVYVADIVDGQPLAPSIVAGSFARTTGYTEAEVAAAGGWLAIQHPDDLARAGPLFAALAAGNPFVNEYRIFMPDGEIRWLRDHCHPTVVDGKLVRLTGGVQDITVQKGLEHQLGHAQRMEALARMAGSVAHDFNNILLVMTTSLGLLDENIAGDADAQELAAGMRQASRRGAELTSALLAFGRKQVTTPTVQTVANLINDAVRMLENALTSNVKLNVDVNLNARVEVDAGQFQLVLLNLVRNACQAMPEGGAITIRARFANVDDGVPLNDKLPDVIFVVSDTGSGIADTDLPHIFEPFYSTKTASEGSGLGLATVYGLIEQAHGRIHAESGPEGATFVIRLPTTEKSAGSTTTANPGRALVGGTERILLIEDEAAIRRLLTRQLESLGYTVHSAENLATARVRAAEGAFDVVLSDVALPDGRGTTLVEELLKDRPSLPVVMMSGHVDDTARKVIESKRMVLLQKPFTSDTLARTLRSVLDATRPRRE